MVGHGARWASTVHTAARGQGAETDCALGGRWRWCSQKRGPDPRAGGSGNRRNATWVLGSCREGTARVSRHHYWCWGIRPGLAWSTGMCPSGQVGVNHVTEGGARAGWAGPHPFPGVYAAEGGQAVWAGRRGTSLPMSLSGGWREGTLSSSRF